MEPGISRGVYSADRAAALSGVPQRTVYYWASHDVWTPSRRMTRPKLWTYSDVLALRIIYWLRKAKPEFGVGRSPMLEVRRVLDSIRSEGAEIWEEDVRVFVDTSGHVFYSTPDSVWRAAKPGQAVIPGVLDLLAEFPTEENRVGPDLVRPRPRLRIIPGKLSGEPHVEGTRISTLSIAGLLSEGLSRDQVRELYLDLSGEAIDDAWDLEEQLQANLAA